MANEDDYLAHYGVLGMKWGVRNAETRARYAKSGRKSVKDRMTEHRAKKDAKKFARAKMYYGQGAGNRRKLIKATVQERSKNKVYKDAFESAMESQNMAKHVKAAKKERKVADVVDIAIGRPEAATAATLAVVAAASAIHAKGLDRAAVNQGKLLVDKMRWIKYMNSL